MEFKEENSSDNEQLFGEDKNNNENIQFKDTNIVPLPQAYINSGGFGKFQTFIIVMTVLQIIGPVLLMTNLVYFELKPEHFICTYSNGSTRQCTLNDVCHPQSNSIISWEIDSSYKGVKNIVTDFGMICESKFAIGLIGSMYFIGEAVGSLIYIIFASKMKQTRINHLLFRNLLQLIVLSSLVLLFRSVSLLYFGIFMIGLCQSISIVQGIAYTMEMMPFEKRNLISMSLHLVDKVILCITTIILKYYGSNWVYIMIPGIICTVFAGLLSLKALDSPQFHHDQGNYSKAKKIFAQISRWNGVSPSQDYYFEKEPLNNKEHHSSGGYQSFKQKEHAHDDMELSNESTKEESNQNTSHQNTGNHTTNVPLSLTTNMFENNTEFYSYLLFILVLSTCVMNENILHYSLKSYEGDIYNNTMILMLSGSFAIYLSFYLIQRFHAALSLSFAFLIMAGAGFIYPSLHNLSTLTGSTRVHGATTLTLCFAKLGAGTAHSLASLFILWQFNAKHYSFIFATGNLFARLFAILAPEIGEFSPPIPMFVVAFTSSFCGIMAFLLYVHIERQRHKSSSEINLKEFDS